MAKTSVSREQVGRVAAARNLPGLWNLNTRTKANAVNWYLRYTFYAFVFSLPFEDAFTASGATLPKIFGVVLAVLGLLQPKVCYRFPPKAFWYLAAYLFVVLLSGLYLLLYPPNVTDFLRSFTGTVSKIGQSLILFWISYNLMRHDGRVITGTLWALAAATLFLAVLQILGVTSEVSGGRVSAFEGNPNALATVLSLGLLAVIGLAYVRKNYEWKGRTLFWLGSGIIVIAAVQAGSRGGLIALILSLSVIFLKGKSLATKLKLGLGAFTGILILISVAYQFDAVRKRWERSFYEQSFSGRETIYPMVVGMILERPLTGWGPVNHHWELGSRLGTQVRDEHNTYFFVLAEVGLVGAVPFFIGLWMCWWAAWKSRNTVQGILPLVMLLFVLFTAMKGSIQNRKYFWVVTAYALASGCYVAQRKRRVEAALIGHRRALVPKTERIYRHAKSLP